MKLYEVTNGFMGNSMVHVLVAAESEKIAKGLARRKFKESEKDKYDPRPSYWQDLEAEIIFDDLDINQVSEIRE